MSSNYSKKNTKKLVNPAVREVEVKTIVCARKNQYYVEQIVDRKSELSVRDLKA